MFVSTSKWVSLLLAIVTMITWGTNKIAVKYLTYPVSLYLTLGAKWFGNVREDTFENIVEIFRQGVVISDLF